MRLSVRLFIKVLFGAMMAVVLTLSVAEGQNLSPEEVENQLGKYLEQKIHDYLLNHPEVVVEALQAYETKQRQVQAQKTKAAIRAHSEQLFNDPGSPVGGNPQGDVTLVAFFDYNCPYCRQMTPLLTQLENKDPQLRVVYKEIPVLTPTSRVAARAALAARKQAKYLPFHKKLMEYDDALTEDQIIATAEAVGLDVIKLRQDMKDPDITAILESNFELANELSITATPSIVIGVNLLGGVTDLETIEAMINEVRSRGR